MIADELDPGTAPGGFTFRLHDGGGGLVVEQSIPAEDIDQVPPAAEAAALRAQVLDGYTLMVYDGDTGAVVARVTGSR